MSDFYNLVSPFIPLALSVIGIVISIFSVLYSRNLNEITRQQLELEREKFLAEIAKQGPIIQIAKSDVVYSLDTSTKPEKTDVLRGKLKGYRYRKWRSSPEARIGVKNENSIVRLKEIFLDLSVIISNVSDVPIQIERLMIYQRFRPKLQNYLRWIGFLIFDFTSYQDLYKENYCEIAVENNEYELMMVKKSGVAGLLDGPWNTFCDIFEQLGEDKEYNNCKIEFYNENTSEVITNGPFILPPKSKTHWRFKFHFTKRIAQELYKSGYGPKDITLVFPWEGDLIAKIKEPNHIYSIDYSEDTYPFWAVEIANPRYY